MGRKPEETYQEVKSKVRTHRFQISRNFSHFSVIFVVTVKSGEEEWAKNKGTFEFKCKLIFLTR